jgi:excisionase family DNA binding protein
MSENESPYVNINKVAEYYQVSVSTVRKWMRMGKIPASTYIGISGTYRFRLPEVEAALTGTTKEVQDGASTTTNDGEQ